MGVRLLRKPEVLDDTKDRPLRLGILPNSSMSGFDIRGEPGEDLLSELREETGLSCEVFLELEEGVITLGRLRPAADVAVGRCNLGEGVVVGGNGKAADGLIAPDLPSKSRESMLDASELTEPARERRAEELDVEAGGAEDAAVRKEVGLGDTP